MIPKVTIIVPVYNVVKHIKRCAVSLFEQTFEDIEYIFVNDCTPDNSIEVLNSIITLYPNRKNSIRIIKHEKNRGVSAARNSGLNLAKGQFVLHIDSDDYVDLDMIEQMYNKAIETNADIVICDFLMQWNKVNKVSVQKYSTNSSKYTNMLLCGEALPGVNKMVKKTLYQENKIYYIEGIDMGDDYVVIPRLAYYAKVIAKVDMPFYHYVQTNANSYTKNYSQNTVTSLIKVLNYLTDFFENKQDKELYSNALLIGKLKKKIFLLIFAPYRDCKSISNLFPEIKNINTEIDLALLDKVTLFLANKKLFLLLKIFVYAYYKLIGVIQILKGRRL